MAEVLTVRGPLAADQLGRTLPQEHLLIELARVTRNFDHFLHDGSLATIEACRFRDAGGGTIVDLANRNLGGDPTRVVRDRRADRPEYCDGLRLVSRAVLRSRGLRKE